MYHLTLQQIHIFLKCYEECNYSTVAFKYNYTPSAVSKLIHTMEELLGYKLFKKRKKSLKPTVEADILAVQWGQMIDKFESGLDVCLINICWTIFYYNQSVWYAIIKTKTGLEEEKRSGKL